MNSRQKLIQKQFLNNEEAVIKRLNQVYGVALNDINGKIEHLQLSIDGLQLEYDWMDPDDPKRAQVKSMIQSKIYQKNYQEALQGQVEGILNQMKTKQFLTVSDYLNTCYEDGFVGSIFDLHGQGVPMMIPLDQTKMVRAVQLDSKISKGLYTRLGEDVDLLKKKITAQVSRSIATGVSYAQTAKQLAGYTRIGYNNAVRIARTEGHRIQCNAAMDVMEAAKAKGADVVKQWDATLDDRTREDHVAVDGEIREVDEKFSNGLMFPGDPSGEAADVINCRCALLQRARWNLGEDELQTLKDRAEYFGLDKSKQLDDFKKKYMKAVEAPETGKLKPDEIKKRIDNDQKQIDQINADLMDVNRDIGRHSTHIYDEGANVDKDQVNAQLKKVKDRQKELDDISDRWYNRPAERGTDEYYEWREWKKTIDIDTIFNEQVKLGQEAADLSSLLRKRESYEDWIQWKKNNPLSALESKKTTMLKQIDQLKDEIDDYQKYLRTQWDIITPRQSTDEKYNKLLSIIQNNSVDYNPVMTHVSALTEEEIINVLSGGDKTKGSCASVGLAYIGQKQGWNVLDFRDGVSRQCYSSSFNLFNLSQMKGMKTLKAEGASSLTVGNRLLKMCEPGKEYYLCVGRHASIVRKTDDGVLQYLELQSATRSGWTNFDGNPKYTLQHRFGCRSASSSSSDYDFMIDLNDSDFSSNDDFRTLLGYINTSADAQRKGSNGTIK